MKILIHPNDNNDELIRSLCYNGIEHTEIELYDSEYDAHFLPKNSVDTLVILDCKTLFQIFETDLSIQYFFDFLNAKSNQVWIYQNMDSTTSLLNAKKLLVKIDSQLIHANLSIIHDSALPDNSFFHTLSNISSHILPLNVDFRFPIIDKDIKKHSNAQPFLMTMVIKKNRPHRKILKKYLEQHPELLQDSNLIMHKSLKELNKNYIGEKSVVHNWHDGHPSMSLYNNSYFEIVPETAYKEIYLPTEKTAKPIATMTPFLVVSTCGYLKHLRQLGFKTFDGIINESYDDEPKIENRIKKILIQMEYIQNKGAKVVYEECLPILEHNFNHLCFLNGSYQFVNDKFIRNLIQK